MFVTDGGEA